MNSKYKKFSRRLHSVTERVKNFLAVMLCSNECSLCGRKTNSAITICTSCAEKLFDNFLIKHTAMPSSFCSICGKELISEIGICQRCRRSFIVETPCSEDSSRNETKASGAKNKKEKIFFDKNFALFPYIGDGQKILTDWKNKQVRSYANFFAKYVERFITEMPQLGNIPIVPVPPRPKKMRLRGWDQIDDLTKALHAKGLPVLKCLKRKDGLSQKSVKKNERATNLKNKFACKKKFSGKLPETVLLVDDVITTGATINECAKILKKAGCKKVYSLCLFFD